jgi:hypothetical protein
MKTKQVAYAFILTLSIIVFGCEKPPTPTPSGEKINYKNGVLVANEGPFGSGSGTISFYYRNSSAAYNDIFEMVNDFPLGNIVQSVNTHNKRAYVVVNNAGKVEVVVDSTFKSVATINNLELPRHFLGISNAKGYVTEWGNFGVNGAVKVIDLNTNGVTATIATGKGAERMVLINNTAYVACGGGFDHDSVLTLINTTTDAVSNTLTVGPNPSHLQTDANGKLWVLCVGKWNSGYTALEKTSQLVRVNPTTNTIEQSFTFGSTSAQASNLVINTAKDKLYYTYNGSVYEHSITAGALSGTPLISKSFYSLGFDAQSGHLFGGDAGNFSSNGYVYRYTAAGNKVDSFSVGVIPTQFNFN